MTRQEYMTHLEKLLWDISEGERQEALQYYNDYFEDAGEGNEEEVIQTLGSPIQVARKIKAGFQEASAEYSELGYEDVRFRDTREVLVQEEMENWNETEQSLYDKFVRKESKGFNGWKVVAILLLCIIALPVILPLGVALVATILALVVAAGAVVFSMALAGVGIGFAGLVLLGAGLAKLFLSPAVGLTVTGAGCILLAIGLLMTLFFLWCGIRILPGLLRGIVELIRKLFGKVGIRA